MTAPSPRPLADVAAGFGAVRRDAVFDRTGFAGDGGARILCCAAGGRYLKRALAQPDTAAVITTPDLADQVPEPLGLLVADDPEIAFWRLHNRLALDHGMRVSVESAVDPSAEIHPAALVAPGCRIGAGVRIGAGAIIEAGTVLAEGVHVGAGVRIGCEGLFVRRRPGLILRVEHAGGVEIGPDAVILPGAMIQRDVRPEFTRIGARSVIANRASISHGTRIGDDATVAGGAIICGHAVIGDGVWIGPGAVVRDRAEIGAAARVEIGAVVGGSVGPGERVSGVFAGPHRQMVRLWAKLKDGEGAAPPT